jgi:hypothetical protein
MAALNAWGVSPSATSTITADSFATISHYSGNRCKYHAAIVPEQIINEAQATEIEVSRS